MTTSSASRRHLSTSPFKPAEKVVAEEFAVGDMVTHDKHGLGHVVAVELLQAVVVDFGAKTIRLTTPFAMMTKL